MHIRKSFLHCILSLLFIFSITGCEPKHLGPEARRDGVFFSLHAPAAKNVAVSGNFNQWDIHKDVLIGPDSHGIWSITLTLPEGRYEYLFLVNMNEWELDPGAPWVDDGFGGRNSVVVIIGNKPAR